MPHYAATWGWQGPQENNAGFGYSFLDTVLDIALSCMMQGIA